MGQSIIKKSFNCTEKTIYINTQSLTPGVYVVKALINNESINEEKLIINR